MKINRILLLTIFITSLIPQSLFSKTIIKGQSRIPIKLYADSIKDYLENMTGQEIILNKVQLLQEELYADITSPNDFLYIVEHEHFDKKTGKFVVSVFGERKVAEAVIKTSFNAYVPLFFTKKPLPKGGSIGENDVYQKSVNIRKSPKDAITSLEEIKDKILIRNISSNIPLKQRYLKRIPDMMKGQKVLILLEGYGLRITTKGILNEEAFIGENTKVVSLSTKKELMGKLIKHGTVKVLF